MSWKLERLELPPERARHVDLYWISCHRWGQINLARALCLLYDIKHRNSYGPFRIKHKSGAIIRGDQLP